MPSKRSKRKNRKKGLAVRETATTAEKDLSGDSDDDGSSSGECVDCGDLNNNNQDGTNNCVNEECQDSQERKDCIMEKIKSIIVMHHNKSYNKILSTQGWLLEQQTMLLNKFNKLFRIYNHNQIVISKLGHCVGGFRNRTMSVAAGLHEIEHLVDQYDVWKSKLTEISNKCMESKEKLVELLQPMMYEVLIRYYGFEDEEMDFEILEELYQKICVPERIRSLVGLEELLTDEEVNVLKGEINSLNVNIEVQMTKISKRLWDVSYEYGIREPPAKFVKNFVT